MALAAPIFYDTVVFVINLVLLVVTLVVTLSAFIHCLLQRADAFPAIGTLPKGAWLAIIGVSMLLSLLFRSGPLGLFSFIAVIAAAVYLLDVRPALRDATGGKGPW